MAYREHLAAIEAMVDEGIPFEQVEARIEEATDLNHEAKSALWLYAWAEQPRSERRKVVASMALV
jgi:hypothetical protein